MFYDFDIFDENGNIDHNVIVVTLEELFNVSDGRMIKFVDYSSLESYESEDNQIALGNKE